MFELIKPSKKSFYFLVIFLVFSCSKVELEKSQKIDYQANLGKKDFRNILIKNPKKLEEQKAQKAHNAVPIPAISKMIVSPPPPVIGGEKLISFSVTDQVPLKDVLIELARVAKIDVDIDPKISGGIIINAKSRPLKEVIDRIATLGNLRYSYKNGVLYFESDTPYLKNYFVDYLVDGNLWKDVEANIASILTATAATKASSSLLSDDVTAAVSTSSTESSFTSNKPAGIIALFATNKQHEAVVRYLADVERSASAQVLIESKLVEVVLSEDFRAGIDWSKVGAGNSISVGDGGSVTTTSTAGGSSLPMPFIASVSGILNSRSIDVSVSALEAFGTTRALASPRIHAINNQKATLNFGDKLVYFKIDNNQNVTTTSGATPVTTATITSTKQEESIGIKIEIVPSINLKTEEITLSIKPTISSSNRSVTDPASPTNSTTGKVTTANEIPVIQTTELSTIAKIHSGNIVVIGGLMKETAANKDNGVPFISRIPIFGWLFKSTSRSSQITETVIFVKATIVNSGKAPSRHDREFQEKFDTNTQPFFE